MASTGFSSSVTLWFSVSLSLSLSLSSFLSLCVHSRGKILSSRKACKAQGAEHSAQSRANATGKTGSATASTQSSHGSNREPRSVSDGTSSRTCELPDHLLTACEVAIRTGQCGSPGDAAIQEPVHTLRESEKATSCMHSKRPRALAPKQHRLARASIATSRDRSLDDACQPTTQHRHWIGGCAVRVLGGGWAPRIVQELPQKARRWVAMLDYGAYKHRATTHPGSIRISIARRHRTQDDAPRARTDQSNAAHMRRTRERKRRRR